jgi:hypothetical protein
MHTCRYWQPNMNNVKANKTAHKEAVRDLRCTLYLTNLQSLLCVNCSVLLLNFCEGNPEGS